MTPITHTTLRGIGFRLHSTDCDNSPHMVLALNSRCETALEICEPIQRDWPVWLRSDIAHSRCRFCFLRGVEFMEQLERLIEAITDRPVQREEFDADQFAESLAREREDCQRRYQEYCRHQRWSHIP